MGAITPVLEVIPYEMAGGLAGGIGSLHSCCYKSVSSSLK